MTYDAGHPCCAEFGIMQKRIEALELALARASAIIDWMSPDVGKMCPPDGGFMELNEHWLDQERRARERLKADRAKELAQIGFLERRPG